MSIVQRGCILALMLLGGCRGEEQVPVPEGLVGNWRWVYAYGGPLSDTTSTLGAGYVLTMTDDGHFSMNTGADHFEGTYSIAGEQVAVQTKQPGPLLRFSTELELLHESECVVVMTGDTLVLRTLAHDDFDHFFVRLH